MLLIFIVSILKITVGIYLLLAVLSLIAARPFSSCGVQALPSGRGVQALTAAAYLVMGPRLQGAQVSIVSAQTADRRFNSRGAQA